MENPKKDGGAIYENLKDSPAVLRMENGRAACLVHIGYGEDRKEQQDRVVFGPNGMASIDGMGGEGNFGGIAAQILAVEMQKGFEEGLSPEEIHQNAFLKMQEANIGSSGACYMAFQMNGRTINSFSAGDVKLAVVSQKGEMKYDSVKYESIGENSADGRVTNAIQGTKAGVCRLHEPMELDDEDRIFMGSDGFWNQFPGGVEEVAKIAKNFSAEKAVTELNRIAMERMMSGKPDAYEDNLNIIVYDYNATFGKGEPSPLVESAVGNPEEDKQERKGIIDHVTRWLKKTKDLASGEKEKEFDWSHVFVDQPRRRRILDSLANKEGTWDHELSYFEKEDPEQPRKEEELMHKIASGKIGPHEISHFLRGIKAPVGEEDDPLIPEKLFTDISTKWEGEVLSMTKLISELAGTPNEKLTAESLGQFLIQYPEPTMLQDRIEEVLTAHMAEKDKRDFVQWPEFMRATLWAIYGKRAKYGEQITLLYKEAEKKYPEMARADEENETAQMTALKKMETDRSGLRERIMEARYASDVTPLYVQSMENIFEKLRDESGGTIDESILYDERLYRRLDSDELRLLAHDKLADLTGIGSFYNYDEDLLALAHVLYGKDADLSKIKYEKIIQGPYSAKI